MRPCHGCPDHCGCWAVWGCPLWGLLVGQHRAEWLTGWSLGPHWWNTVVAPVPLTKPDPIPTLSPMVVVTVIVVAGLIIWALG